MNLVSRCGMLVGAISEPAGAPTLQMGLSAVVDAAFQDDDWLAVTLLGPASAGSFDAFADGAPAEGAFPGFLAAADDPIASFGLDPITPVPSDTGGIEFLPIYDAPVSTGTSSGGSTGGGAPTGHYKYIQNFASDVWIIDHELGGFPTVTVIDSSGDLVFGQVNYPDTSTVRVSFSAPLAGYAYLIS